MLAQDRAIRRSLAANDQAQRRSMAVATEADAKKAASAKRVALARARQVNQDRTAAGVTVRYSSSQIEAATATDRATAASRRQAGAYDAQAAAAKRAAAAQRATLIRAPRATVGRVGGGVTGGVGVGALSGPAAVAGLGFGLAVAETVRFDRAMRNVNSLAQLGERRFRALSEAVRGLAGRTAQAPETLAEGMYDLVSSGFSAKESLGIVEKAARAATAGLTTTDVSTKAIAGALNAYEMPARKAGHVSDVLFRTVDKGQISFEELAQSVGGVLAWGPALGVSLEELGAAISTMTVKTGGQAEENMTRLRGALVALVKPSETLKDAFDELGVRSGTELIKKSGSLQGALQALYKTTHGNKEAFQRLFPDIRGAAGALLLTGKNAKAAGEDLRGMKTVTGATGRALSQQSKSISVQWAKMAGTARDLAIEGGSHLIPMLGRGVHALGGFVRQAREGVGVGGQFRTIIANVGQSIGSVAQAVGPAIGGVARLTLSVAEFGSKLLASKAGITILSAAIGGLVGHFAGLAIAGVVAGFGSLITVVKGASVAVGLLGAAIRTNPIGAIATVVGVVAGAIFGLNSAQKQAAASANDLADANADLYDSYKRIRDLDLAAQEARLAHRQAVNQATLAENALLDARRRGVHGPELEQFEIAVAEARLQVTRTTRGVRDIERDQSVDRGRHIRQGNRAIAQDKERVEQLKRERNEIRENVQRLRTLIKVTGGTRESKERLRREEDKLREKNRELADSQDGLNEALRWTAVGFVEPLTRRFEALGIKIKNAQWFAERFAKQLADIDSSPQLQNITDLPRRGGGRRRGGRFHAGGMVDAAVSSGEMLRLPDGSWAGVPGPRVARDNVRMLLPHDTEVYTDHGQALLAAGASRSAALSQQVPHFQGGGRVRTRLPQWNRRYAAHGLGNTAGRARFSSSQVMAIAQDAGFAVSRAGQMAQIARGESSFYPGIVASDGGIGLWQMTPWAWGGLARSWMNQLGGSAEMRNPIKNARMAKRLYDDAGGFGPWYGTKYLTGPRDRKSQLAKWAKRTGEWGTETFKGRWRPTAHGVPAGRLDRYRRRQYLAGLAGTGFQSGYQAGLTGIGRLIDVEGIGELIGGARIAGERPTRKVRTLTGTSAPKGGAAGIQPGGGWGGSKNLVMGAVAGMGAYGFKRTPSQNAAVGGSPTSDHLTTIRNAYAADVPPGDRNFGIIKRRLAIPATPGSYTRYRIPGLRDPSYGAQLLWRVEGHYDHNHLGVRRLRRGGVVGFQGGGTARGRATPVQQRSAFFGASAMGKLDMQLARLRQLASKANYDATLLLSEIADRLDDAHKITFRQLARTRRNLLGEVKQLLKKGTTAREEVEIRRLRAALDVVEAEMGRRTGMLVRHQQQLARVLEGRRSRLEHSLRRAGVDQASIQGIAALIEVEETAARNLKRQRANLRQALAQAKKAGDREAVAELREQLREVGGAVRENVTSQIELARQAIAQAATDRVSGTDFMVQFRQGQLGALDARQRLSMTADTAGGMRQRAAAIRGTLPAIAAQRDAAYGQFIALTKTGDLEGARQAYLAAQAAATDLANAQADAADLIREAAKKEAQDRVNTAQFRLDRAQGGLARLEANQRLAGTADDPEAMRARAGMIRSTFDELAALRTQLYAQAQTLLKVGDTEGYQQSLLAAENAGTELASAMADAADLLKQAALTAAENAVQGAGHVSTMADMELAKIELKQRLAGTFETTGGAIARSDYIKDTIIPALEAEIGALTSQQQVATQQGDKELADQIAEAIAGKQNEVLQAQLDAQEETAKNTDKMVERMGTLGFEYGGQDFTDLVGAGTGV